MTRSALYVGETWHRRWRPVEHGLRYKLFMVLLDLEEGPSLSSTLRLFGYNRAAPLCVLDRDHLSGGGLRAEIEGHLAAAGLPTGGRIQMLCMPRVLGQVFNPLTVFLCFAADDDQVVEAVLYEVNNTFGERHSYLLRAEPGPTVRHSCDKRFYVSPFMDMDLTYRFTLRPPTGEAGSLLTIHIDVDRGEETLLSAAFNARRQPLTDRALAQALIAHPLLMLKVVAGIHWEALRLWIKGMRLRPRPPAPDPSVTVVS